MGEFGQDLSDALKKPITRAELFAPFRRGIKEAVSAFKEPLNDNKDRLTEFFGEGAALAAIACLAIKGAKDPVVSYEITSKGALKDLEEFQRMNETMGRLGSDFSPSHQKAKSLQDKWHDEFRESRQVDKTRTVSDGEGGTKIEHYTETEHYWDEPDILVKMGLDNNSIGHWVNQLGSITSKTAQSQAKSGETFDLSGNKDSLTYNIKEVDSRGQTTANVIWYGAVGAAFVFYEEIFNSFDKFGKIQQNDYITRRTFMKIAAAGTLTWAIRDIQLKFVDKNTNLFQDLSEHNAKVLSQLDVKDYDNFTRFFGSDLHTLRNNFTNIISTCSKTLEVDTSSWSTWDRDEWQRTKPFVEDLATQARENLKSFDTFFHYSDDYQDEKAFRIPPELTKLTKYIWATEEITGYANAKANEISLRHFENALGLGVGLAVVAGLSEKFIFPLTDKIAKKD